MGSSVGIGALIMGVTLLSVFAIATSVISNQTEVALAITTPEVTEKPELSISNLGNSGSVDDPGGLSIPSPGTGYWPGDLDFTGNCDQVPDGEYTVSKEEWQTGIFPDDIGGNYDGHAISFQELDDEQGGITDWYVWYSVDGSASDPGLVGTGIMVEIVSNQAATAIRDDTLAAIILEATLSEIEFQSGGLVDNIIAQYDNAGPATDVTTTGGAPFSVITQVQGGRIIGTNLVDSGSGCTEIPTISINPDSPGGSAGSVIVANMVWDFTFQLTNDGDGSIKFSEIFVTYDGGSEIPTEVLSTIPAFTSEYLFPGEKVTIFRDINSDSTIVRVAISSHGMNIAVEA